MASIEKQNCPVIAIDGPSASGKGTVAARGADALGFHYLDSGALYRLVTLAALQQRADLDDATQLARIAGAMDVTFTGGRIWLRGRAGDGERRTGGGGGGPPRVA